VNLNFIFDWIELFFYNYIFYVKVFFNINFKVITYEAFINMMICIKRSIILNIIYEKKHI